MPKSKSKVTAHDELSHTDAQDERLINHLLRVLGPEPNERQILALGMVLAFFLDKAGYPKWAIEKHLELLRTAQLNSTTRIH